MRDGTKIKLARQFRKAMTHPEARLWTSLKTLRHEDITVRRQHPVGPYILDFYCERAKLAIEVDGEIHNRDDHPQRDERRDAWLLEQGIETLRIPAFEIMLNPDETVAGLLQLIRFRASQRSY